MDDQLDKDLSKRIQEVFDNYEDASANEGWLKLREKFPEERKRRGLIWLWPAAAVLLLFLGLGLVMLFNTQKPGKTIANSKPVKQNPSLQNTQKDSVIAHNSVPQQSARSTQPSQPNAQAAVSTSGIAENNKKVIDSNGVIKRTKVAPGVSTANTLAQNNTTKPAVTLTNAAKPANTAQIQSNSGRPVAANNVLPPGVTANQTSPLLARLDTTTKKGISLNNITQPVAVTTKPNINAKDTSAVKSPAATKKSSNIDELFAADQGKSPERLQPKNDKRVKFGIYAATYVSYAQYGKNQVNGGGGFTAAIPLTQKLRLVTGASVNQNSFSYNNSGGLLAAGGVAAMAPANYTALNGANFSKVSAADYSHSASLLGVDIPLNLQYQLNSGKNPVYVLGGFSSGTFINESYSYLYSNGSSLPLQSYKGFNDFYFARTLNLGFGVGYPVGKSQIIIEPFLKYPLIGTGAQQIKFGASGINLKFNFPTKK